MDEIPTGVQPIKAYETEREIILLYGGRPIPEGHSCDEMGCGTCSHVWMRIPKSGKMDGSHAV